VKRLTEEIIVNEDDENPLLLKPSDEDGFLICEIADGNICSEVYIYYNDIGILIDKIRSNILDI